MVGSKSCAIPFRPRWSSQSFHRLRDHSQGNSQYYGSRSHQIDVLPIKRISRKPQYDNRVKIADRCVAWLVAGLVPFLASDNDLFRGVVNNVTASRARLDVSASDLSKLTSASLLWLSRSMASLSSYITKILQRERRTKLDSLFPSFFLFAVFWTNLVPLLSSDNDLLGRAVDEFRASGALLQVSASDLSKLTSTSLLRLSRSVASLLKHKVHKPTSCD